MKYTVLDYLESTASLHPNKVSFSDPDGSITFSSLLYRSRSAATILLKYAKPNDVICVYLDKSVACICAFFGAVYAGCAYSQLNLRHPPMRLKSILDVLNSPVVVTDSAHIEQLVFIGYEGKILLIEQLFSCEADEYLLADVRKNILDIDPLYVNFTSGSTGTPKGVVVNHRSVIDFISCFVEVFSINSSDIIANQAPFDFDVSVKDIYSGIFTGAQVAIVPTQYFMQPTVLIDYICDQKATVLVWAVSALCFLTTMNALAYRCPSTLRVIMFSGEVMPIKHLRKLQTYLPNVTYVNLYGPTEITCNCTYYIVDRQFGLDEVLPIGQPFPNERIIVLDENNQSITDPNKVGELCVSGTAVAMGYFGSYERTAVSFCQNPLNPHWLETIYRTGDLVKFNERNELVYVSRKDFQIKHMGHRIELGEIDAVLSSVNGIERVCCCYHHQKRKIVAFICGNIEKDSIKDSVRDILPGYMIPNVFVQVDNMPMNKNGKIDRAALMELFENKRKEK